MPATVLPGWQRDGGAEDVVGIVVPLGADEPVDVASIASRHAVRVATGKQVRIATRKRHLAKGVESASSPPLMPLLL